METVIGTKVTACLGGRIIIGGSQLQNQKIT